jgi:anaerobic magnesium-protoporphyrin IX monomethyl ester cyclase
MTPQRFTDPALTAGVDVLLVEDLSQQRLPARALAAVLRQAGHRVKLAHFRPRSTEAGDDARGIAALAGELQPRLVLFSILFAGLVPEYLALAGALRSAGVAAHVSMAGPLPSFVPSELLAACPALDSVLCGEAEASVVDLAAALKDPARRPVPGLACRAPDGSIRKSGGWPDQVSDLDRLPFPSRDGGLPGYRGYGFATVEGSRGCYHACAFCLPNAFYRAAARASGSACSRQAERDSSLEARRQAPCVADPLRVTGAVSVFPYYRSRSVGNLVDEIEALCRQGARLFLFDDEQFLPPQPQRGERIAHLERELARRDLEIAFTIKCRPDDVEPGLFRQLQRMGLLRVYVGVESGCQASLDLFGKGVTAERNLEALATLDRLGVVADFFDLLFHPWSTLEAVAADIGFCRRAAPHLATPLRFSELGVLPGTGLAARLQAEGRSGGEPWALSYELADPRAEILRRLNRLLFTASAQRIRTERILAESWFSLLLERRFRPSRLDDARAGSLRDAVARLNRDCLGVWSEMLECARAGLLDDAGQVNAAAARWAERVNIGGMRAAAAAADLGLSPSDEMEVTPSC